MNRFFAAEAQRALAIGAHPDDIEVGAGGLIARLANEGCKVTMVICSIPNQREQRVEEAREGAKILGADLLFLNEDRECRVEDIPMHTLVKRLDTIVGDLRPDLVVAHAERDLHWDHGLVHRAVVSAMRRTPCDVLTYMSSFEMNAQTRVIGQCLVDITGTLDAKLSGIAAHRSQLPNMHIDSSRDLARAIGRLAGVQYAEALEVMRMKI